jgi:YVTN family beta-propeller protein
LSGAWIIWAVGALAVCVLVARLVFMTNVAVASTRSAHDNYDSPPRYLSPEALKLSHDGDRLFVACADSNLVLVVDTHTQKVIGKVAVDRKPEGLALSPDGKSLFVSSSWNDTITEIDADSLQIRRTMKAGWGPVGITTDRTGRFLYTANTLGNDISVIDLSTGHEIKRLGAGHFPKFVALSGDGRYVYVSNLMVRVEPYDKPPLSQLTVVDASKKEVSRRIAVPGVIQLRHIAEVPSRAGDFLIIPFMRPKNLNPLIQVAQGWYMTHGIAVVRGLERGAERNAVPSVAEVLLDDIDSYYADGYGAAVTPDGRWALVTASGANIVSIINTAKLQELVAQYPASQRETLADRLDSAQKFVARRLRTGRNPTDIAVSPDGRFAYIANRTDDTVSVVDMRELKVASTIDLGGPKVITVIRRGQQVFYDASFCFQGQMACASCHPNGGVSDGLAWSLETPQLGRDVVENRTLINIAQTSPFKWNGHNPDIETQAGPRTAMYIFRSQGFGPTDLKDLVTFIHSLRPPPNPRVGPAGQLNDSQERGREIFFRTRTSTGALIPPQDRCYFCHPPATHYTSRVAMDVGTATQYDTIKEFDIPQLEGVYMRPPYLHNGEAVTLEEIWTIFNPEDKHGITSDMDKVQLNDLIEYLKTL